MDQVLNDYLTKMEKYLKVLPASERIDIVNGLKSEMVELTNQGTSSEEILNRLGKPKLLARAYLADEISKMKKFSFKKFAMVFSFYSYAGVGSLFILPIISILAVAFIVCGIACPLSSIVKLIAHLLGYEMPYLTLHMGSYTANAIEYFALSLGIGIVLFLIGWGFWKLTLLFIKSVGKYNKLKNKTK